MRIFLILCLFAASCGKKESNPDPEYEFVQRTQPNDKLAFEGNENSTIQNLPEILTAVNANKYLQAGQAGARGKSVRIAIFDNGFGGLKQSRGNRLPPDTRLILGNATEQAQTIHGTKIAEIVYAVATGKNKYDPNLPGPSLTLFNTNGFSNLESAVNQAIAEKFDMIVYAQVWEFGGNFDGTGFINDLIKRATGAGILWINAAGNYRNLTYGGKVSLRGQSVVLPFQNQYVRFRVKNAGPVKITLAWSDFTSDSKYRTNQDLDLALLDSTQKELMRAELIQDGIDHNGDPKYSSLAREIIDTRTSQSVQALQPGTYYLKVNSKGNLKANLNFRIFIASANVELLDKTPELSLPIAADCSDVLTVGTTDSDVSSIGRVLGRTKPEISTVSKVKFDGAASSEAEGSSTATAIAAGAIALYKSSANATLEKNTLIQNIAKSQSLLLP